MSTLPKGIACFVIGLFFLPLNAQEQITPASQKATQVHELGYQSVPSIASKLQNGTAVLIQGPQPTRELNPKMRYVNQVVPGKGSKGPDLLADKQRQVEQRPLRSVSTSFDTMTSSGFAPSDPSGAVGADYFIASWNVAFQIYAKDGTPATPVLSPETIFGNGKDDGDQIVLYDAAADRYIITQFDGAGGTPPNGFMVAVSQTNDPVNGGWHVYNTSDFGTPAFPDYTKFSIWSDGYYVTANTSLATSEQVWALERDQMLVGAPAQIIGFPLTGIQTAGFYSPQAFNVSDGNLPANGNATIVYMQDDAWAGVTDDHLKLWTVNVDWTTPSNSTISSPVELTVTDFIGVFDGGSFANLSQPDGGVDIDVLQATIMNQAQFRKFGTHNSVVFNFVVDADASLGELAAIRWYELRQSGDGQPWSVYQEGTYVAPSGRHAFAGSMAMDSGGNIGMGYTSLSDTERISLRFTGRFNGDPLGVMTGKEGLIVQSTANDPTDRYADYAHLTVDADDTFWYVSEYFAPNRKNRSAVFTIDAPLANDVGVIAINDPSDGLLGANENVTIQIKNYGTNSQSNFLVSYRVGLDAWVTETYAGPLAPGATGLYTFTQTADLSIPDQTYSIRARTSIVGDGDTGNDQVTKNVVNALNYCEPASNCSFDDGVYVFQLGDINKNDTAPFDCPGSGYLDTPGQITDLDRASGNNVHNGILQVGFSGDEVSIWADFNDDGDFDDPGEFLRDGVAAGPISPADTDFPFSITIPTDAPLGTHRLRVRAWDPAYPGSGSLNNPCDGMSFGLTEDFRINVVDSTLGFDSIDLETAELAVISRPNKRYEVKLRAAINDKLFVRLYNMLGQELAFNMVEKGSDGNYSYTFDMSYAASGVYLVKIGRGNNYLTTRILVD